MAGLRKIKGGKWKVEIRRKGFPSVNKRFHDVKLQESLSERLSLKWREVAKALELIGAVKKAGCPVESVGKAVTIWVLQNQKDYQNHTAAELGKKYVPFYNDSKIR